MHEIARLEKKLFLFIHIKLNWFGLFKGDNPVLNIANCFINYLISNVGIANLKSCDLAFCSVYPLNCFTSQTESRSVQGEFSNKLLDLCAGVLSVSHRPVTLCRHLTGVADWVVLKENGYRSKSAIRTKLYNRYIRQSWNQITFTAQMQ